MMQFGLQSAAAEKNRYTRAISFTVSFTDTTADSLNMPAGYLHASIAGTYGCAVVVVAPLLASYCCSCMYYGN